MIDYFRSLRSSLSIGILLAFTLATAASAENPRSPRHMVFNLTGSMHGFGDTTGPLWILFDMKKYFPRDNFTVILDERSKGVTREIFNGETIAALEKRFRVTFVDQEDAAKIKKADYSFELFFGGRWIHHFTNVAFNDQNTITFISDTMHGTTLDEIRQGDSHIYFKPPGVGSDRSGIVNNPDISLFRGKTDEEKRGIAARMFDLPSLQKVVRGDVYSNANISFFYGVHNELMNPELVGQTEKFVQALKKEHPKKPLLLFTPNTQEELAKVLSQSVHVLVPSEIEKLSELQNEIYVLSLGSISSSQFTSLMAVSNVPILVEGNSAISTALRMNVPFIMYRSPWNTPQVRDMINIEDMYCKTDVFGSVYDLNGKNLPAYENYFPRHKGEEFYQAISIRIPTFARKLATLVDAMEAIKDFNSVALTPDEQESLYIRLSSNLLRITKDEYLAYSLMYDAFQRKVISQRVFDGYKSRLERSGFDLNAMQGRLRPNVPNFSIKIEALQKQDE